MVDVADASGQAKILGLGPVAAAGRGRYPGPFVRRLDGVGPVGADVERFEGDLGGELDHQHGEAWAGGQGGHMARGLDRVAQGLPTEDAGLAGGLGPLAFAKLLLVRLCRLGGDLHGDLDEAGRLADGGGDLGRGAAEAAVQL